MFVILKNLLILVSKGKKFIEIETDDISEKIKKDVANFLNAKE